MLEGVSYDDFVVPDCPVCLEEGRRNSVVRILATRVAIRVDDMILASKNRSWFSSGNQFDPKSKIARGYHMLGNSTQ